MHVPGLARTLLGEGSMLLCRNCCVSQCFEEQRRRRMSKVSGWEGYLLTGGRTGQLSQGSVRKQ